LPTELQPALLQAVVTGGTAAVHWYLYLRNRRADFLWWSVAWTLYVLRIGAIIVFLATRAETQFWLFVHQILTGYTAIAILWAALTYTQAVRWRAWYAVALLFPLGWSYVAIYQLESFILAALPAVLFLSFATLWTGLVFLGEWRRTRSRGSAVLAAVLVTWAAHHLDYPILRARGAWNPWGYYLDILFVLAMVVGIILVVVEELDRRTRDLERLSMRMVTQHEEERRRVSLELHDQTAQVWAAVKMQLGLLRESAAPADTARLDRVLDLVDTGIRSIRDVTTNLRPPLLDDLGVVAALRALVQSFSEQSGLAIDFDAPATLPRVSDQAGLALYRALQESLSNVVRHAHASAAHVRLSVAGGQIRLAVTDNGRGIPREGAHDAAPTFGLAGMRERIHALNGTVLVRSIASSGTVVTVHIPVADG